MNGLDTSSLIIIGLYLVGMILIGLYFQKKVNVSEDYFLAGRTLNSFIIMATVSASIIGGGALIGRGGVIYSQGVVAIWIAVPYLIGMYFFSMISGRIQAIGTKYNIGSIPDLMEFRFGKAAKFITAILVSFTMMATVGTQITATATIIKSIGGFSYELGAWIAVLVFVSYTVFSGLFGVVYTDVAQFIILILFIYILLPIICLTKIGGINNLVQALPKEMLSFKPSPEIIGWIFTNLIFTIAGAEMWQRAFAARSPKEACKGMFLGNTVYGLTIIVTLIIGLSAYILLPNVITEYGSADIAIPALVIKILPKGIAGLSLAAVLSVLMSSSDTYLLVSVQSIVRDILKPLFPTIDGKQELFFSRITTIILGFGALLVALYIRQVYAALMFAWSFYASSLGIPAFAALYWEKATTQGIISSILMGFFVSLSWKFIGSPYSLGPTIPGSLCCALTLVIVSLSTYKEKINPFPQI